MIVLHTRQEGDEFALCPEDIRIMEVHGSTLVIYHLLKVQLPPEVVKGPQGPMTLPPRIETMIRATEVMETMDEVQHLLCGAASGSWVVKRCREEAQQLKNRNFGGEPRNGTDGSKGS